MKYIVFLICLLLISNFISIPKIGESYIFSTKSGDFTFRYVPSKGGKIANMEKAFNTFQAKENKENLVLYRTFEKNYFKFWKWKDYLTNDIWLYPYSPRIKK